MHCKKLNTMPSILRRLVACYSLFLNRDPGDAPRIKGKKIIFSHSRDRLGNPTSSLNFSSLRR